MDRDIGERGSISKEDVRRARQADLAAYLISVGVPLVSDGRRYRHAEHDSLVFTDNAYVWNSKQERGNAIDYLTRYMGMNFKEAVSALTNGAPSSASINVENAPSRRNRPFNWSDISTYRKTDGVERYLDRVRNINLGIVDFLLRNKLLFQEQGTNNAIFPIYDEHNIIVGAELKGITNKPFKGIAGGSKYGYGFNIRFSEDNKFDYALFFEGTIDLLSYIDYKTYHKGERFKNCILISMMGLKLNILEHSLKVFAPGAKAVLCVDNDISGQNFIKKIDGTGVDYALRLPDEQYKDWNEQITMMKRYCNPTRRALERARESLQIL
ncbi:MAG: DUF3991 and toprim domain-containing protein [Treponema sp.]|nr:DUF3991 and toprim domain-containing protein [Treponema sp.]